MKISRRIIILLLFCGVFSCSEQKDKEKILHSMHWNTIFFSIYNARIIVEHDSDIDSVKVICCGADACEIYNNSFNSPSYYPIEEVGTFYISESEKDELFDNIYNSVTKPVFGETLIYGDQYKLPFLTCYAGCIEYGYSIFTGRRILEYRSAPWEEFSEYNSYLNAFVKKALKIMSGHVKY